MKLLPHVILLVFTFNFISSCHKNDSNKIYAHTNWENVQSWSLIGKMAISDGQDGGSGKILWQRYQDKTLAQFKAPLGHGSWRITETKINSELISSKTGIKTAKNAHILISQELGWDFPWQKLGFWLRGYNSSDILTKHNVPRNFIDEDGWHISYDKWIDTPIGKLPKKIKAVKSPYLIKLFIYTWEVN